MQLRARALSIAVLVVLLCTSLYGDLVVTEILGRSIASIDADWWELTNTGDSAIDLTGYSWEDDSHDVAGVNVFGAVTIGAGESIIVVEIPSAAGVTNWKNMWGLDSSVQVVGMDFEHGLGGDDGVVLFNPLRQEVTRSVYDNQPDGHSAVFGADSGFLGYSLVGSFGSWQESGGADTASPGVAEVGQEEVVFDRKVFWTDKEDWPVSKIQRVNSDLNDVENILTASDGLSAPRGIDIDFSKGLMYWASSGNGAIYRSKLDGSEKTMLVMMPETSFIADLELDLLNGDIYFSDIANRSISKVSIEGGSVKVVFTTENMPYYFDLDVVGGYIYYSDVNERPCIWRYDINSRVETVLISGQSYVRDIEIDKAAGKLYFNDRGASTVSVANLDGSGVMVLYDANDNLQKPHGLAKDFENDVLYFTDTGTHAIYRAAADGTGQVEMIVGAADTDEPWELVVYQGDADIDRDYICNLKDFALLANQWYGGDGDICMGADLTAEDGVVDVNDLEEFVDCWLE